VSDQDDATDDRALLRAHLAGDPDAFGTLFARHRDRLWAVALRTTGDPEEAADALQEALIAAFRRADSYRGDAAVTTWLHRIVVNACLDRLRRRKVRRADPLPDGLDQRRTGSAGPGPSLAPGAEVGPAAAVVDPAEVALDGERRAAVLAALETLPLDQRAALVLVDMEGYSVQETAAILDCAPGTVKSRCSRGRARLLPLLVEHRPSGDGTDGTGGSGSGNPAGTRRVPPVGERAGPRKPRADARTTDQQARRSGAAATPGEEVTSSDA
jgi:RNA polymerase sigma-70 factor (ECF subfamily)